MLAAFIDQPRKQTLLLIDAQSGETRTSFPVTGWRWARFLPGDRRLLAGCMEGQYQVFSLETRECEASFALDLESEHVVNEECFDVSGDGCFVALCRIHGQVTAARVLYEYDFPGWQDDDKRLSPFLTTFQRLHPQWTDADFDALLDALGRNGLGFIRPEAVRKRLVRPSPDEKPLLASLWEQHPDGAPKSAPRPNPRSAGVPIARPLPPLQPMFPVMPRVPQPSAQKPPQPTQKPSTPPPAQKPPQKPVKNMKQVGCTAHPNDILVFQPNWNQTVYSTENVRGSEADDLIEKIKIAVSRNGFSYEGESIRSFGFAKESTFGDMGLFIVWYQTE